MTVFLTKPSNIQALYYHLSGRYIPSEDVLRIQREGLSADTAAKLLPHYEELDLNGFEFGYESDHDRGPWIWQHVEEYGYAPGHKTLEEAVRNAYWHHVGLYKDIRRLSKLGFTVIPFGDPTTFYWRYCSGNRNSPLFPTEEAAWRDARRVDKEVSERVRSGLRPGRPGDKLDHFEAISALVPRVRPAEPYPTIMAMVPLLEEAGYTIKDDKWEDRRNETYVEGGMAEVIRDALRHWAFMKPKTFTDSIVQLNGASSPHEFGTRHLEDILIKAGYVFAGGGWNHPKVDRIRLMVGDRATVVLNAFHHYAVQGNSPSSEGWTGGGNPPVNEECVVTPHNTQWGFDYLDPVQVVVRGYHGEWVWLQRVSFIGKPFSAFITTRTDKVDFSVSEEQ